MQAIKNLQEQRQLIGDLDFSENKSVTIAGFLREIRNCGKLLFLRISDISGEIQVLIKGEELISVFNHKKESVLLVHGTLKTKKQTNLEDKYGSWEIVCEEYEVLSEALKDTPFTISSKPHNANEDTKLQYRYLDLRSDSTKKNILFRSKFQNIIANFLINNEFVEINTPILSCSTQEGAKTFNTTLKLNNIPHEFSLAQSPQLYKQLLMMSGFEKYFQFANVFRLEDLRSDRQYEFSQLDIEVAYKNQDYLFDFIEKLLLSAIKETLSIDIKAPFPRITYKDSYEKYGVDKPDISFQNLIEEISQPNSKIKYFALFFEDLKNIDIKKFIETSSIECFWHQINDGKNNHNSVDIKNLILEKYSQKRGHVFLVNVENEKEKIHKLQQLGKIRSFLGKELNLCDHSQLNFLWVVEWPLFEWNYTKKTWQPAHHLFTKPAHNNSEINLEDDFSRGYDLVLNGTEIASGSERINDQELQKNMFEKANLSAESMEESFGWFLNAMNYGVPPHMGIAIGMDRLIQLLLNLQSIRDVIAFPKNNHGICQMTKSPKKISI